MSQRLFACCCPNTNVLVYLLVILFGVASWVDINGLWVELPILVQHLPEGWDLPSYMAVIIQVANVAPLLYTIISSIWPHRRIEVPVIYVIISVGAVSCLLLALFWDKTASVAGTQHSIALLTLQFFLALVDCTSSVAFLPFMSVFKPQYMIAYFIGEGFSGLIPSLVSLGQGAGSMKCVEGSWSGHDNNTVAVNSTTSDGLNIFYNAINETLVGGSAGAGLNFSALPFGHTTPTPPLASSTAAGAEIVQRYPVYQPPKFTVQTFFLFLMALLIVSLASFTLLNYWSYCKKEYVHLANNASLYEMDGGEGSSTSTSWQDEDEGEDESDVTSSSVTSPMTGKYMAYTEVEITDISGFPNPKQTMSLVKDAQLPSVRAKIYNPKSSRGRKTQCCNGKINSSNNRSARGLVAIRNSSTATNLSLVASSSSADSSELSDQKRELKKISKAKYALYLILTAWINALVCGVLPSIQTYSCLPYGIRPYHLSVTLASISNPVACFAALFLKMSSTKPTVFMTFLGSALSGYLVLTAAMSPTPPLVDHHGGGLLVILSWVVVIFFLTYTKVSIGMVFRKEGRRALLWVGAFTQVGALIGALAIFFIINYHHLFQWANPCM